MPGKTKPQPKPNGRPVVITEETQEKIIAHLANGGTVTSYCKEHPHIARQTVFNFMLKEAGQTFKENVTRARKHGMHAMAEDCLKIIDDPKEDTMRARNRVELRMKLAAAWNREAFGPKMDSDVTQRLTLGELVEAAIKHAQQQQPMLDVTPAAQLPGAVIDAQAQPDAQPRPAPIAQVRSHLGEQRQPRRPRRAASQGGNEAT
jgi:hypothetical protein